MIKMINSIDNRNMEEGEECMKKIVVVVVVMIHTHTHI
jgi:hypothetical protein